MNGHKVTLNIDLGELPDESDELVALATVVNVACGGHAGDAESMARVVALARRSGAELAAHPSYPDKAGFGPLLPEVFHVPFPMAQHGVSVADALQRCEQAFAQLALLAQAHVIAPIL